MNQPNPVLSSDMLEKLQQLVDKQEILECIYRYSRGLDRHDDEILASVFHEDAVDNHGAHVYRREDFVRWANYQVHSGYASHMHHITSHTSDIDGDEAHAESYVIFVHRYQDGRTVHIAGGRYIDRLERRDGEWRIALRTLSVDFRILADGSVHGDWDGYPKGTQDRTDPSYLRPLVLPPEIQAKYQAQYGA